MKKIVMILAMSCAGCATTLQPVDIDKFRPLPSAEIQPCPSPTPLTGLEPGDLADKLAEVATLRKECKELHDRLIKWVLDGRSN